MRVAPSVLSLSLVSLVLAGCYASHDFGGPYVSPTPDGGTDGRTVMPPPPPPPPTGASTYVISRITIPSASPAGVPGANLDGMDSGDGSTAADATCEEFNPDFASPDGTRGVDNAYSQLVNTIEGLLPSGSSLDEEVARAIAEGRLLLALELIGSPPGAAQMYFAEPVAPIALDSGGALAPGQTFRAAGLLSRGMGGPSGRRVTMLMSDFMPTGLTVAPVIPLLEIEHLRRVEMRFELTPFGLGRGEFGAVTSVEDGVAYFDRIMPGISDTVRSVLESVADIQPSPADPAVCVDISFGMTFEAVPAVLVR